MCFGGGGPSKSAQIQEAINIKKAREAERPKPALQNPEDILNDERRRKAKGRKSLRIPLDDSVNTGAGLAISQ